MAPGVKSEVKYCCGGFDPDDVVITGIAGRFPESDNVAELCIGLYSGKDFFRTSEKRFDIGIPGLESVKHGLLKDLSKFDAEFFGVTANLADDTDPHHRLLMQVSYEAIMDSGYDVPELKGRNIGVYASMSEMGAKEIRIQDIQKPVPNGYARCMSANKCSYAFDFHGPSIFVDTACSSTAVALFLAFNDIREGRCEAAIVSGCELILSPESTLAYINCGIATIDKSAPFDANSTGIIRSEAAAAIFVQKASHARRVYATVSNVKIDTAGWVNEGISVPSRASQLKLHRDTFEEIGLKHLEIDYIEAHGTGTNIGDPIELNAIATSFCKDRTKPLYVGTVKSNIGHTEVVAGLCGIIKAILAFETGMIAPNNYYETPNPACQALVSGDIQVVVKPTPLTGSYISVSSYGFGGVNVNIILKKNHVEYSKKPPFNKIHRIVLYPATTEAGVQSLLDYVCNTSLQSGFFSLLNNLSYTSTVDKSYRGYAILNENDKPISEVKRSPARPGKVWYVMTGMGCQWPGMGLSLMKFDIFAESMKRCAKVLEPFGINLFELLEADKDHLLQDRRITPAFVTIAAIQVALVDLLTALGLEPDGIVGHSTGELACAYAAGCCTVEQTMLSAYWRGNTVETADLPCGAMAAVGITWEEAIKRCPENVYPACHNADDSITISGLTEPLEKFVEQLKSEKIFARVVNVYGYAFHCKLVWPAANALRTVLQKIITDPKPRTERWLSSSFVEAEWDKPECKMAGTEYFVHNLMSSVHFSEVLKKIPSDAIIIEIGPHFLLQSILKQAIGPNTTYMALMKKNQDNVDFLLQTIGQLYTLGLNPKVAKLYPPAQYPVPRSTPCLSDQMKWNTSTSWKVLKWQANDYSVKVNYQPSTTDLYLMDHCIQGRPLFPATGYICVAWEALSNKLAKKMSAMAITVTNIKIYRPVILTHSESLTFSVFLTASGDFEILESNSLVASGRITSSLKRILSKPPSEETLRHDTIIRGKELYDEVKIYGYQYGPAFRGIIDIDVDGRNGLVTWNGLWIPYLDTLLHFFGIVGKTDTFHLPTGLQSIKIDPCMLNEAVSEQESKGLKALPVTFNPNTQVCASAGVEITRLKTEVSVRRIEFDEEIPTLEEYVFVPYMEPNAISDEHKKRCLQYMYACDEVAKKVSLCLQYKQFNHPERLSTMIQNFDIESYIENASEEEHGLLIALQKILSLDPCNQTLEKRRDTFQAYIKSVEKDMMYNTLISKKTIRIALDIIAENRIKKLSLLEMHRSLAIVSPMACKIMHTHIFKDFIKCTVASSDSSSLDENILSEFNIVPQGLASLSPDWKDDVVISSVFSGDDYKDLHAHIKTLISVTQLGGFILLFCRSQMLPAERFLYTVCEEDISTCSEVELEDVVQQEGLLIVSKQSDGFGSCLYLFRNTATPSSHTSSKIVKLESENFETWVDELKTAITQDIDVFERIWIVSDKMAVNGTMGMVNCLRQEFKGERIRCLCFISSKSSHEKLPPFSLNDPFYAEILKKDLLMNVYKDGRWGSFRHLIIDDAKKPQMMEHCFLNCARYGDLSSFQWIESPLKYIMASEKDKVLIHIYYASINFKDVMIASGKVSITISDLAGEEDCLLGFEFCGRDSTGRRVMGSVPSGGLATTAYIPEDFVLPIPDHWSLEEAATVPVVYLTCYMSLMVRGQLKRGESILIHSGTGGIGQAAIRIALSLDCEIFTTVGSELKRKYLKEKFPQIKEENIGCSRDTSFENLIMERTYGKGVSVILNSLADEKFHASLRCLAAYGRFLEIGQYDLSKDNPIGLGIFLHNRSFHGISMDGHGTGMSQKDFNAKIMKRDFRMGKEMLLKGIERGVVQPLDRTVFQRDEAEKAFRYMAAGTHVGKVLLKIRDEEAQNVVIPKPLTIAAVPVTYFYAHKVYIVIGGFSGFGIELTKWMAKRGAHHIVLTSRSGARTSYHHMCLKRWEEQGLNVVVSTLNVARKDEAEKLLQDVTVYGPIGGIFNSALVLRDAFMENQTVQSFKEVCAPKAAASKHLDELSRSLCPSLDYFVCFSSTSSGKGGAGQANYGYANSVMERICEQRTRHHLHGLAVQWGVILDVGFVQRNWGDEISLSGAHPQSIKSCLKSLDAFCRLPMPVVTSSIHADMKVKRNKRDILSQIAKVFGLNSASDFNVNRSFSEMGMDSMIGVEMKQLLDSYCDTSLTMQELNEMKLEDVKNLVEKVDALKLKKIESVSMSLTTSAVSLPKCFVPSVCITHINAISKGTPILIVSLGDNELNELSALAEKLPSPTFVVQWTQDTPMTDMQSMARWYLQEICNFTESGQAHLIGYRLGANLAFEIAVQSKNMHWLKTFGIIGGLEIFLKSLDAQDADTGDENSHLIDFVMQFAHGDMYELKSKLDQKKSLEQKVTVLVNDLQQSSPTQKTCGDASNSGDGKNALTAAIYAYLKRRNIINSYHPKVCIEKDCAIIESSSQLLLSDVAVVNSLISKICSREIWIHRIACYGNLLDNPESLLRSAYTIKKIFSV